MMKVMIGDDCDDGNDDDDDDVIENHDEIMLKFDTNDGR